MITKSLHFKTDKYLWISLCCRGSALWQAILMRYMLIQRDRFIKNLEWEEERRTWRRVRSTDAWF